jgi:hypothetical protein
VRPSSLAPTAIEPFRSPAGSRGTTDQVDPKAVAAAGALAVDVVRLLDRDLSRHDVSGRSPAAELATSAQA